MYRVLIIEDEILSRIGLRQLIPWEKYGFALLPDAADGEEALNRIREHRPDYQRICRRKYIKSPA